MSTRAVAPPAYLSLEDYMRDWKPHGWEILPSDRTFTYRPEWGLWEAIREIVQNALDEAEAYESGYDSRGLWISDRGGGVIIRDFLMGAKRQKPEWMRGMYGEGMKIGALALMREGHQVHILTKGRELWSVMFPLRVQISPPLYDNAIHLLWRENGAKAGTTWYILGYTGTAFADRFAVNIPKRLILARVPSPVTTPKLRVNELIEATGPAASNGGGKIYARDIYLQDIRSKFSYNLWGFALSPDRHAPLEETALWTDMGRLWCGVQDTRLLEKFLRMTTDPPLDESDETRHVSMDQFAMGTNPVTKEPYAKLVHENSGAWKSAWSKVAGAGAVIRTSSRWDGWVKHLGHTSISLQWGVRYLLGEVILTDVAMVDASQDKLRQTEIIPDNKLSPIALVHLNIARKVAKRHGVTRVHAALIPPASDMMTRTAGLYTFGLGEITIDLAQLDRIVPTLDTVIHELGHHQAYIQTNDPEKAEDLTPAHARSMTAVAGDVIAATAAGLLDAEYREAKW